MATSETLAALNRLARTYAPALLTVLGRTVEAGVISGGVAVNSAARMAAVTTRLATLEAQCWAEYVPAWDPFWEAASNYVFDQVVADNATLIATCMADPDIEVWRCLKTALRALEMAALRFVAGGGVLP